MLSPECEAIAAASESRCEATSIMQRVMVSSSTYINGHGLQV